MIREATPSDLPLIVDLGRRFYAATGQPGVWNNQSVWGFCGNLIATPGQTILVSQQGMIGGVIVPLYWDHEYLLAHEAFWWSEDRQGRHLLEAFEAWARAHGAREVHMSLLSGQREKAVRRVLVGMGYAAPDEQRMVKKWQ